MSKWAVRGLTLGMADKLLPHGIIVNAIAPGPTATPMFGMSENDNIYNAYCPAGRFEWLFKFASKINQKINLTRENA